MPDLQNDDCEPYPSTLPKSFNMTELALVKEIMTAAQNSLHSSVIRFYTAMLIVLAFMLVLTYTTAHAADAIIVQGGNGGRDSTNNDEGYSGVSTIGGSSAGVVGQGGGKYTGGQGAQANGATSTSNGDGGSGGTATGGGGDGGSYAPGTGDTNGGRGYISSGGGGASFTGAGGGGNGMDSAGGGGAAFLTLSGGTYGDVSVTGGRGEETLPAAVARH
ncbi:MAG: hypothetical protein LBB52_06310 [Desulfovibrio sp.]|jgi:hypothetical protein|nr:hypothetical protein [Desulfovibrio sp.]